MDSVRIFDIERFSTADGPGIRTVIFFKGCPLRCRWCHNPEGLQAERQLSFDPKKCIGCRLCEQACPNGCHRFEEEHLFDRDRCISCFRCAALCPSGALEVMGREVTIAECMEAIRADIPFYGEGPVRGGVTLTGGEVLLQSGWAAGLLAQCRKEGVHTAIESSLSLPYEHLAGLLEYLDLVMTDIKHMDPEAHRQGTGAGNERILRNIRRMDEELSAVDDPVRIVIRTPVIPGFNDSEENIARTARFAQDLKHLWYYELLTYNPMGIDKGRRLGQETERFASLPHERMQALAQTAAGYLQEVRLDGRIVSIR